ncbi:MAG: PAS domain S-box protein [Bacteroidales bacterium]|nr:PAS domain S-box protein [Bacteroidales bacterium]
MLREHLSYDDLLKENAKLKQQLSELEAIDHLKELVEKNAQLNEYNEELKQTFEQIKVNQRKLEESENRFKLLENNISDVIWMLDLHGSYSFISSSAVGMFGYLENEITDLKINDLLTEESYEKYQSKLSDILEKEEKSEITGSFSLILEHKKKNGKLFWAEISANPMRNKQGKFIGLAGISRDISERMKAENEIRKLSEVIEQSPTSIVITDLNGQINYVNSTFCRVTGYAPEEVIGKNPKILKSGMTSDSVYEDLWAAIYRGEVWRGEFINRKKNGETYWERAIIAPIKNHLNQVTNYVAIKENITAQKLAEQELIDSQQRYKLLSDISPEGLIIHENGLILDVSSSVSKITGFDIDELLGNQPVEK